MSGLLVSQLFSTMASIRLRLIVVEKVYNSESDKLDGSPNPPFFGLRAAIFLRVFIPVRLYTCKGWEKFAPDLLLNRGQEMRDIWSITHKVIPFLRDTKVVTCKR